MHLRTFSPKVFVLLASLMFFGSVRAAEADTITLMWDANPEPEVAGYIVHVGTQPATYTQHIDVGLSTTYALPSAVAGQQYCFAVSAYFAGPLEGAKSSEVCGYSNRPPTLVNPGSRTTQVSQSTSLQLQGTDPDGQPVTYSATGLPAGLTLQSSTGFISGTPTSAGAFTVNATVSDGVLTASQSFTWTVTAPDATAPTVTITGPTSATTYTTTTSTVTLTGSAADNLAVTQVTWVNNRGGSGTAAGTTSWSAANVALQAGANVLTVTARDAAGNTATDVVTATYNAPPTLASVANQSTGVGQAVSLQLVGSDPNGTALTYSATGLPAGLSVGSTSGLISGAPTTAGAYSVTATVSDGTLTASRTFSWTIVAPDTTAPAVTITAPTSAATYTATGTTVALSGTASDNIGVLQVTWANNRGGSGTATGTTTWSVSAVALQTGANVVTVTARDAAGNIASDVLTVNVNGAPTLMDPGARSSNLAESTSLQLAGSDPNGDTLAYSVTALPPGMSLTASNGLIAGTPVMTGTYPVTATVSDGALSASQTFTWTITANASASTGTIRLMWDANTEAGIAGYIVHAGTQAGTYAQHYDVGLATTYLFSNAVLGQRYCFALSAYFTGPVEGPKSAEVCGYANIAPTLASVSDQSSSAGQAVTLQLSASDPEGGTWVNDRGGSGTAIGTASWSATVGVKIGANVFTVTARDAAGNRSTAVVTVYRNVAPTLSSVSNRTNRIGQTVSLQLVGADANGDVLTYSETNLPPGLSLDASTGLISGSPTTLGTYTVTVSVTDGTLSRSRTFTWTIKNPL